MTIVHRKIILGLFAVLIAAMSASRASWAADPAEVLVREGVELRRAGRDADALDKFSQAYDLSHTPRAAAQLGLCQMALDNFVEAEGYLTEALAAQSDPWIARNRAVIEASMSKARTNLGAVQVTGGPLGALVTVNGKMIGKLPKAPKVYAAPGQVTITVSAAGFQNETKKLALKSGEVLQVPVQLTGTAAAERVVHDQGESAPTTAQPSTSTLPTATSKTDLVAQPIPPAASSNWKPAAGWVSVSVGALALAFGVNSHLTRESKAKEFNNRDDCGKLDSKIYGSEDCQSLNQSVSTATTLAAVGYASTAVFAGLGLYWLLDSASTDSPQEPSKVSLLLSPSSVLISGAF